LRPAHSISGSSFAHAQTGGRFQRKQTNRQNKLFCGRVYQSSRYELGPTWSPRRQWNEKETCPSLKTNTVMRRYSQKERKKDGGKLLTRHRLRSDSGRSCAREERNFLQGFQASSLRQSVIDKCVGIQGKSTSNKQTSCLKFLWICMTELFLLTPRSTM